MKYWIIVASKDHMQAAKEGSYCQACHGKKWPLAKMSAGDGILFYSSKEKLRSNTAYQKFTAIGFVEKGKVSQQTINANFKPYRRKVKFLHCEEVKIHPLLKKLHFVDNIDKWGYKLMNGFLEINKYDFELIKSNMLTKH
ncbi:EVE domain-containing protein [Fodinibius saliphilus]|uniref:EVE domain-containing protein n=1 Tax=Fodinibius saliphilus TaxID=1920650 RepID=UPI001107E91A|nr:EVE domain-containing protein [Fodinibius saliphilus]